MSARKTPRDRAIIDQTVKLRATVARSAQLDILAAFQAEHGDIPRSMLAAFAGVTFMRGFDAGVRDAMGDEVTE
jgi:hypothetical protein